MAEEHNQKRNMEGVTSQQSPFYYPVQEEEINISRIWNTLTTQRILIVFLTGAAVLIALAYAVLATPIYRAEAVLAPVIKEQNGQLGALVGQFGGLASLAGINLGGGGRVEEVIATLKSRELTSKLLKDENLLPVLFESKWDKNGKRWKDTEKPPSFWEAYKKFNKTIRNVSINSKTGLITLSIDWKDPVLAAEWVNKLIALLNNQLRQKAIKDSEKRITYLKDELQKTSIIEVKESIYTLIEAETKTKMLANTQKEYAVRVIDGAVVPEEKIKPKKVQIIVLGFIVGGMIGIFSALLVDKVKPRNVEM